MNTTLAVPAKARNIVYLVFSVVALTVGAIQVGYAAIQEPAPAWLRVALAVVPFVGAGIGYTASTHTPKADSAMGNEPYAEG